MKKLFGLLAVLGLLGGLVWIWKNRGEGKIEISFETKEQIQRRKDAEMAKKLQEYAGEQKYAVKVFRLTTGETYGFNEDVIMPARSAIKVPIIITAVKLGLEEKYVNLLERMGKYSDNNAQDKMEKNLGEEEIKKTLNNLGMTNTNFEENTTTANDLEIMWKYVYENQLAEKYLTDSIWEDRIAKGIPEGTKLVHKVGTDIKVWNDSGIIYPQCAVDGGQCTKPFILVILNDEVGREGAIKMVPELTKMVWDYETSL